MILYKNKNYIKINFFLKKIMKKLYYYCYYFRYQSKIDFWNTCNMTIDRRMHSKNSAYHKKKT